MQFSGNGSYCNSLFIDTSECTFFQKYCMSFYSCVCDAKKSLQWCIICYNFFFVLLLLQHLLTVYHQEYIPTLCAYSVRPVRYQNATKYFCDMIVDLPLFCCSMFIFVFGLYKHLLTHK